MPHTEKGTDARPSGRLGTFRPQAARQPSSVGSGENPCRRLIPVAGEEIERIWGPRLRRAVGPNEFEHAFAWVVGAVECAVDGLPLPALDAQRTLSRFLVEKLATSLIHLLGTDPETDKSDTLSLLRGLDQVRSSLEADWEGFFGSQLTGPDGLALVTEIAHDLRSPLTSIRCLAEAMERGQSGPVTDQQRTQLRLIYSAALGLGSLTTDVIEMARRGDQLAEAEAVPFSVAELLQGVADVVRPIAQEKGVAVVIQRLASDRRMGPQSALGRVLLNLVTNGLKFTDEGRVELQVRATGLSRVEFAVADTGRGIADEVLPDLYKPFRRTVRHAGRAEWLFSGAGLGLSLCRKLVESMGGELQLATTVGVGTRFSFEIELPPTQAL